MHADASSPSDEEETRRRAEILARACDELSRELQARGDPDAGWQIEVLHSLREAIRNDVRRAA